MTGAARPVNAAYERGWAEGWAACLARAQALGWPTLIERERDFLPPQSLVITVAPAEPDD